ncbi:MAG: META domain-containing protein [Gammaproteobacteria bacterium]
MPGKVLYRSILISTVIGLISACSTTPDKPIEELDASAMANELEDTSWEVLTIYGNKADAAVATLQFSADNRVSGATGCNNFSGQATLDDSSLDFGLLATTRKMCTPALNGQERVYLEALDIITAWQLNGNTLELTDAEDQVIITLTEAEGGS